MVALLHQGGHCSKKWIDLKLFDKSIVSFVQQKNTAGDYF
jgi:hypothetical protein